MTQLIDLGKLRFYFAGSYNSSVEYELNDVVKYGGNVYAYVNALATTGNLPTNTVYWSVMVEGINFEGTYNNSIAYQPGDAVTHGGNMYLCENISTGNTPPNTSYWSKIASGIQYEGAFNSNGSYQKDDIVSYGGSVYIAIQDTTGSNAPSSSGPTAYWTKLVDGTYPDQSGKNNYILKSDGTSAVWTNAPSLDDIVVVDDITVGGTAYFGNNADDFQTAAALTGPAAIFDVNSSPFGQIALHNQNPASSSDIIAYTDDGDDTSGWIDMGITGSTFSQAEFGITGPHDGYIFMNAPETATGAGNLVLATGANGTDNKIIFAAGGFDSGTTQMEITPDVNVHIEIPTPSTSATTGALTVVGGVGISGDVNIAGDIQIVGNLTFGGGSTTTDNLAVSDPLIFVGSGNSGDIQDMGLVNEYSLPYTLSTYSITNKSLTSDIATLTTSVAHSLLVGDRVTVASVDSVFNGTYAISAVTSNTFSYSKTNTNVNSAVVSGGTADIVTRRYYGGIVRDASDGVIKTFEGALTKPTSTVNFTESGLSYSDLRSKNITATGVSVSGASSFTGGVVFSGTTDVQELREQVVDVTLSSNTGTLDWSAGNVYYIATAPTADMTFNLTNLPTDNSKIMTINILVTQGSTGRIPTTFQIGGSSQTIRWVGGSAPTPTSSAGKIDIFSFTMQRTSAGAWIVYGSSTLNF